MKASTFIIAMILFVITIYHVRLLGVAGVYPSKYILKRRTIALAIGSILFFVIGLVIN